MKWDIIIWDERLVYETRELMRLFLPQHQISLRSDPDVHKGTPVNSPGFLCFIDRIKSTDNLILLYFPANANHTGNIIKKIPLPADWQRHPEKFKAIKHFFKQAMYEVMQQHYPTKLPWGILTGVRPVKLAHHIMSDKGNRSETIRLLQSEYHVSPSRAELAADIVLRQRPVLQSVHPKSVSVYIGIPLCPSRCSYCSFISQTVTGPDDPLIAAYMDALAVEMRSALQFIREMGWFIDCLYIGGGTPSLLTSVQLDAFMNSLADAWPLDSLQELTFEAGRPDTITREKLNILRQMPVNRISINPQTFNDTTLIRINRRHTVKMFWDAWNLAESMGFHHINLDLILGLPEEGPEDIRHTLRELEKLNLTNLTVHAMALKRGADLASVHQHQTMSPDVSRELMEEIYTYSRQQHLRPYYLYRQKEMAGHLENVGFSRAGWEGRYNILMMEEKQTILGIGAGAVSKQYFPDQDRIHRIPNVKNIPLYIKRMEETGFQRNNWMKS